MGFAAAEKTKTGRTVTAAFISLGCFKNVVDTEVFGGLLEKKGIKIVSTYEPADWLIINTCGFIRDAQEESIDEILAGLEKKEKGEIKHIAVFGCLIQRYYQALKASFPGADILWGVNDMEELAELIRRNETQDYADRKLYLYSDRDRRIVSTTPNTTFIKISEGCDMTCSFCSIPRIRGPYRSRPIASIVKEAEKFRARGFSELNLISQNSSYYGKDTEKKQLLPELLQAVSKIGFPWVRVFYMMPEEVNDEILESFAFPSILPYFDLPFQHASKVVLKAMKRGGGFEKNLELIHRIRSRFNDAVIRSTFITGFPGEGEKEFGELLRFARKSGIERIGAFVFSAEEGTAAFTLPNRADPAAGEKRKVRLMDVSDENLKKYNQSLVNTEQDFLPLGPWKADSTIGRIKSQAPEIDGLTEVNRKFDDSFQMYRIRIIRFQNEMLFGERTAKKG